ncbi:ATP-binding cassette sub-family A member 17 [Trichonephila clavata]|uniref:ATP-binding cassette sub-family A member 17 n=1 Tax=Trichonephila clavata TaxID=2740835 RepID=A0A8X6M1M3_TRICU|nr:ATP-binding cassette sub-family A member 17 [Trichonephila clavata]
MYLTAEIFLRNSDIAYVPSSVWYKLGIFLLPPGALSTLNFFISVYEINVAPDLSILMIIGALICSCLLFIVGILYFDAVWPWQPGVTKPMYLFSLPSFCRTRPSLNQEQSPLLPQNSNEDLFEESYKNDKAIVVMQNLHKKFGPKLAVNNVSLDIYEKQITIFLGRNGAGKTAIMNLLTEMRKFNILLQFCSRVGFCHNALIDHLTGREMFILLARLRGLTGSHLHEQVNSLIQATDLTAYADNQIQLYSGGIKKKLSVALSLIGSPPLILLDEPTAGLDPVSRQKIWNLLCQVRSKGSAIILSTHSLEEIEALCNRLAYMVNGHFCCLGSIQDLKSKHGQSYSVSIKMRQDQVNQETMDTIKNYLQNNLAVANSEEYQFIRNCRYLEGCSGIVLFTCIQIVKLDFV